MGQKTLAPNISKLGIQTIAGKGRRMRTFFSSTENEIDWISGEAMFCEYPIHKPLLLSFLSNQVTLLVMLGSMTIIANQN